MSRAVIYGYSDDLVAIEGDTINEEFDALGDDVVNVLEFNEGTRLLVAYGGEGVWTIIRTRVGAAEYTHVPADSADSDNYSDRVTIVGDFTSVKHAKLRHGGLAHAPEGE